MTLSVIPHSRPWIDLADVEEVNKVFHGGMIAQGLRAQEFEHAVASLSGVSGGIACTSGTSALVLALKTLCIGVGDEVILPTYVCWSVLAAITAVGASPKLCDVDEYGVLTTQKVEAACSSSTKAIVAVHVFGHPCDIASLSQLGLPIIEDACQSFGLQINNSIAGSIGDFGIFSFHATKCMTTGEGGMLISRSSNLIEKARAITKSTDSGNLPGISCMTDLQAALGMAQLARYPDFLLRRQQLFLRYHQTSEQLVSAFPGYQGFPSFLFRYTLRTQFPFEAVQAAFLAKGIQVRRGVDDLLHRRMGMDDRDFPVAANLFAQTVSVPFHPSLCDEEVSRVLNAIKDVFNGA